MWLSKVAVVFLMLTAPVLGTPFACDGSSISTYSPNSEATLASVNAFDVLPDSDMESTPNVTVAGSSEEFSWNHVVSAQDSTSYVDLNWTHVANTTLDFTIEDPAENLPDCNDFIYLNQTLGWEYEYAPQDVIGFIEFSTVLTGDFLADEYGGLMFEILIWMIDSSGNWVRLFESYPPYTDSFQEIRFDLGYIDIIDAWGGFGPPDENLTFAIGLAPTHRFQYFEVTASEPWRLYNGTVSVKIESASLITFIEEEPDPSNILDPLFNTTWARTIQSVFPQAPLQYEDAKDYIRDIEHAEDGSIYVLVDSSSDYDLYAESHLYFRFQTLLKYNASMHLEWAREQSNRSYGYDLFTRNGHIYTAGSIATDENHLDSLVTKWRPDGSIAWAHVWGGLQNEETGAVAVAPDGSVYAFGATDHQYVPHDQTIYQDAFLLKYGPNGNLLWDKTLNISTWAYSLEMTITSEGIYTFDRGEGILRDFSGEEIRTCIPNIAYIDEEDNAYTATPLADSEYDNEIEFAKIDGEGVKQWSCNYSLVLAERLKLWIECVDVDLDSNGSLVALVKGRTICYDTFIVKIDANGNLILNEMINTQYWPWYSEPLLSVGSSGLAYVSFTFMPPDTKGDVRTLAYEIGPYSFPGVVRGLFIDPLIILTLVGGGVVIAAVVVILRRRDGTG